VDGMVTNQMSLDEIGIFEGTDKTSLENDYLRHYERILRHIREEPFQLLEIGIAKGGSLRTWEKFLPAATIIGVDIREGCRRFEGGRVMVEIGSQADPEFLSALTAKYQPSVIIDDGSHQSAHIFLTFQRLFPALRPGGIYIIEDTYLHHVDPKNYHGQEGTTPADYFAELGQRLASEDRSGDEDAKRLMAAIDRIELIPRAIVIHKRAEDDTRNRLDYLFEIAGRANRYQTWFHLSRVLMNCGDLERAEFAARQALTLEPRNPAPWPRLADLQVRRGKIAEAIETLRVSIKLNPGNASLRSTLAGLEDKISSPVQ
jgi:tetratricopeptide (TPR) repeat protein